MASMSTAPKRRRLPSLRILLSLIIPIILLLSVILCTTLYLDNIFKAASISLSPPAAAALSTLSSLYPHCPSLPPSNLNLTALRYNSSAWLSHFRTHPFTERIGCRELSSGAQSCIFSGLTCINTSSSRRSTLPHPVILRNDRLPNTNVPSDRWCYLRHNATDPRYNAAGRHWPPIPPTHIFAPQQSCLSATFTNWQTLIGGTDDNSIDAFLKRVRWEPHLSLVHFDYPSFSHNYHMLMDMLWMLDASLWTDSLSMHASPLSPFREKLFDDDYKLYLPQTEKNFERQTSRDLNRLLYALVLRLNLTQLYRGHSRQELHTPPKTKRYTAKLRSAYPQLNDKLLFHSAVYSRPETELVCTPRLAVGAKIGDGAHERVCRHMRRSAWKLFGLAEQPLFHIGRVNYPIAPKRILVINRHITRKLANHAELVGAIREKFVPLGFEVEYHTTAELTTAEENVRLMARAGVVITPHGSHTASLMFMPRNSALIEIMPHGYTDYSFNLLADTCHVWFYELVGERPISKSTEYFQKECNETEPHFLRPCKKVRYIDIAVNVDNAIRTLLLATERLGYYVGRTW